MGTSRSEETKAKIIEAAARLFSGGGYKSVTMREIAKEAGFSHTSVHVYFKDKETLLQTLAIPPLEQLRGDIRAVLEQMATPIEQLLEISLRFIAFSLEQRNLIEVLFETDSERVDEEHPKHQLSEIRNEMFALLQQALARNLPETISAEQRLESSRIYYFALYGIVSVYRFSKEDKEELISRLETTFLNTFRAVLIGLKQMYGSSL